MIYFDNAATTRVIPEAADAALSAMCEEFGNPSSLHSLGFSAEKKLAAARAVIADALSCDKSEITFTSCGSESNNLAILGLAEKSRQKKHIVTTSFEHPSVLNTIKNLEQKGFEVSYINPREDGEVHAEDVAAAVRDDTLLVSVMFVNNELGSVMNIREISRRVKLKSRDVIFHTDAVQAFLKLPIDTRTLGADIISISGHKIHAPKGIGAIYIKKGLKLSPRIFGGGQESGLRSGTEAMPQIEAFSAAVSKALPTLSDDALHMKGLLSLLQQNLKKLPGVVLFTPKNQAPHILSVAFTKYPSEVIMRLLEEEGIYVSAGSACSKGKKSYVLRAVSFPDKATASAIRISLCRFNTESEVLKFVEVARKKLV